MSSNSASVPTQEIRDSGLGVMILLSAGLHALIVVAALVLPYSLSNRSPQLVSYTVDLVAPDRLGGTNIPGPRPKPVQPKAEAAPQPPAVEQPKPPEPKPEPKQEVKPPEPPVEPKQEAKPPEPPPQPKEEPKAEAKVEKKPEPKAPIKVAAKKEPAAKPEAKPEPKAEAKKEKPAPAAEKKAADAKPETQAAKKEEVSPEQAREAIASRLRDERLAAAVKRAQERVEQSAAVGTGTGDGSAPASIGPGEGSGGVLKGLEWLMYKNKVETTIRDNWVWTGPDQTLETIIRFGITEAGEVIDVRIEKSSGDPSYDASVERAVKMVNPLPPPPEAYRDDFRQYELTFNAEFLQM